MVTPIRLIRRKSVSNMIYLVFGNDVKTRSKNRDDVYSTLNKQNKNFVTIFHNDTNTSIDDLQNLSTTTSMFGEKYIIECQHLLGIPDFEEWILENISKLESSSNIFFFIESQPLTKDVVTKFKKHGEVVGEGEKVTKQSQRFNVFSISDAFIQKDKKKAWMLYRSAIDNGIDPREISGILFWAVKNLILVEKSKNQTEAGLNPFVYKKTQSVLPKWKKEELDKCAMDLVHLYHDSQFGKTDFVNTFEKFVLKYAG